jgi:uncharacterized membrane protein YedE/YeeE
MSKRSPINLNPLVALVSGLLFGCGLTFSDMINPRRVLGFLDVAGTWDPTLAFVMGGALLVTLPAFYLVRKMKAPFCDIGFQLPTSKLVDARLVTGAAMFGLGWGLVGLCPGPALGALVTLQSDVLIFVVSMLVGMLAYKWWDRAVTKK